jgi:hypothetical protein
LACTTIIECLFCAIIPYLGTFAYFIIQLTQSFKTILNKYKVSLKTM